MHKNVIDLYKKVQPNIKKLIKISILFSILYTD